jgi:peptide chain release factor 2
MFDIQKSLDALRVNLSDSWEKLSIDDKLSQIQFLENEVNQPEIWQNPQVAREKNEQLASLRQQTGDWVVLRSQITDIEELFALQDEGLVDELSEQVSALQLEYDRLKKSLRLTGKYDHGDAILRITSGVGGTEAMDFAGMLERMYLRWAEKEHLRTTRLEYVKGEEAGLKTVVYELSGGADTYGRLQGDHGVHRLVRLSPFNSDNLRQTSFALVEILPVIKADDSAIQIPDKDLRIDVFRSGGKGGQSVNTTDSAVRITHLPTGIVVSMQDERSQLQNRERAMTILRGKLEQLRIEQAAESIDKLRAGESAKWGMQIRNYVLHPYKLVKDTRTSHETRDADGVLDGDINEFLDAYLDWKPAK